jgi:hypothetical protein
MLGDSAAGQQTRDALTVISFAAAAHIAGGPLAVYGRGEAAIAAAFAGLLHPAVTHIIMDRPPASFEAIACAEAPAVSRYPMIPHVLEFFDLPQLLAGRADRQFMVIDPTGADGALLDDAATDALFGRAPSHVTVRKMHIGSAASAWPSAAATWIAGTPAACR